MDSIFTEVCTLVTTAFALTFVPGFRRADRSLLPRRDQGTALLVFLVLGLVEEAAASHAGWFNERIVAVCAAGLVAGPWVGLAVGVFATWLAVAYHGLPFGSIAISMLCGGLAGGLLHRWRPGLAQHPLTGFCLTSTVSWLRAGLILLCVPGAPAGAQMFGQIGIASVLQGLGTALILAVVALARDRNKQTEAAASAEVRALQSRMNPHFLFNALNTLAGLAPIAPREIPRAAGQLRHFLRAIFDQSERALIPLEEELSVVRAYLDIESLRLGKRLRLEQAIDSGLADALIPPFCLQPLVENSLQHGLQSSQQAGCMRLVVRRRTGQWLDMSISDDGKGVPATEIEQVFFAVHPRVHALSLLRRRLHGLFGRSFKLEVVSDIGRGTTVTMRIPFRTELSVKPKSFATPTTDPSPLLSH
jgi:two-component system LytT family sensor kinase